MSIYLPNSMCIIIASHISNPTRIPYLIECLKSLTSQTIPITIYLSISFDQTIDVHSFTQYIETPQIRILVREQKTPQMRHIQLTFSELSAEYKWIMFCDEDDTYAAIRVERFAETIVQGLNAYSMLLRGVYESTFGKDHREHRHEFWCYCIHRDVLGNFLNKLEPYPDVLENKCCDVLLAEFIRRSNPENIYIPIREPLYNYRVENNNDSVTGFIKTNQSRYTNITSPPPFDSAEWITYVLNWNDYLHENIKIFLHDTYLRTLIGVDFEDILLAEFRINRSLLEYVDVSHLTKMRELYDRVHMVCDEIYYIKL